MTWESFQSARSIFLPHLIGSLAMLAAFIAYPPGKQVTVLIAALLSMLAWNAPGILSMR